ncbi:PREDICTED: uncharacterized protein LOC106808911 [Priapulus caudatus]|uniref:Uncharacterized protein LOC106808911 n=1 Tax=Priapulus caudatus TaxID=37621 RepID=A0ABM1E540_PRICU|nr:PREDICTED: uncharacterized protein LOC106808911 [Priapulus caudatus]
MTANSTAGNGANTAIQDHVKHSVEISNGSHEYSNGSLSSASCQRSSLPKRLRQCDDHSKCSKRTKVSTSNVEEDVQIGRDGVRAGYDRDRFHGDQSLEKNLQAATLQPRCERLMPQGFICDEVRVPSRGEQSIHTESLCKEDKQTVSTGDRTLAKQGESGNNRNLSNRPINDVMDLGGAAYINVIPETLDVDLPCSPEYDIEEWRCVAWRGVPESSGRTQGEGRSGKEDEGENIVQQGNDNEETMLPHGTEREVGTASTQAVEHTSCAKPAQPTSAAPTGSRSNANKPDTRGESTAAGRHEARAVDRRGARDAEGEIADADTLPAGKRRDTPFHSSTPAAKRPLASPEHLFASPEDGGQSPPAGSCGAASKAAMLPAAMLLSTTVIAAADADAASVVQHSVRFSQRPLSPVFGSGRGVPESSGRTQGEGRSGKEPSAADTTRCESASGRRGATATREVLRVTPTKEARNRQENVASPSLFVDCGSLDGEPPHCQSTSQKPMHVLLSMLSSPGRNVEESDGDDVVAASACDATKLNETASPSLLVAGPKLEISLPASDGAGVSGLPGQDDNFAKPLSSRLSRLSLRKRSPKQSKKNLSDCESANTNCCSDGTEVGKGIRTGKRSDLEERHASQDRSASPGLQRVEDVRVRTFRPMRKVRGSQKKMKQTTLTQDMFQQLPMARNHELSAEESRDLQLAVMESLQSAMDETMLDIDKEEKPLKSKEKVSPRIRNPSTPQTSSAIGNKTHANVDADETFVPSCSSLHHGNQPCSAAPSIANVITPEYHATVSELEAILKAEQQDDKCDNGNEILDKLSDSFDYVPKNQDLPTYKYKEVVRKHDERQKLNVHDCAMCEKYYSAMDLTAEERKERMKVCSRHRARYTPPSTPDHYWETGFPSTQQCKERGYRMETQNVPLRSRRRQR